MNTFGFYVGHENYWNHAEMLVSSIQDNFYDHKIRILVNSELDECLIEKKKNDLERNYQNVLVTCIQIPEHLKKIPFADKIMAASIYESICDNHYIWLDVDSYFFKSFDLNGKKGIQLNPVDQKNIGIEYGAPISELWKPILRFFDSEEMFNSLKVSESVRTTVSEISLYPYYNIGFVIVNENKGIFKKTIEAMEILLKMPEIRMALLRTPINEIFIHQAVFSVAVLKLYGLEHIMSLPEGVNYPMHLHHMHSRPLAINEIIHMRYDTFFEEQSIPKPWLELFSKEKLNLKMTWYY